MIKSMTGYGKAQKQFDRMNISVEIKSVNHRYFEFSVRAPRAFGFLDEKLKSYVKNKVARGKIECSVFIETIQGDECVVSVNHSLASGMVKAYADISLTYGLTNDASVSTLARVPDIFSITHAELDEELVWANVRETLDDALAGFIDMREKEGQKLRCDVLNRLSIIEDEVSFIEARSPETVGEYRAKLTERMKSVLEDASVDESRVLTEAAIYADKIAVDEETVRLRSHIAQMISFMDSESAIGKKADFLIQEFNREANTIGSKCQDIKISERVINIKSEIEKIREQIQNIE